MPASRRARRWEGAEPGQVTWTSPRAIPYHGMSWPVYEWRGSWAGGADGCSGMGQWVVSNCIVHGLSFLECYFFFCCIPFHYNYYYYVIILILSSVFYFTLVIKLFLSQPTSFTFFFFAPSSSPPHWEGAGGSGWVVLSCWLGLNHDRYIICLC